MIESEIKKVFDHLVEEGYRPEYDSDGDITFKKEGRVYVVLANKDDPIYIQLLFPAFWPIESDDERAKAMAAALHATAATKVAKVFLVGNGKNVSASFEMFCTPAESFRTVMARAIRTLEAATGDFVTEMRK